MDNLRLNFKDDQNRSKCRCWQTLLSGIPVSNDIYFCHGWQFDIRQRVGHVLYGSIVRTPNVCKTILKAPFELKILENEHRRHGKRTHKKAKEFLKERNFKYMIMGHTHVPLAENGIFDCGDMLDHYSYILIENGIPELKSLVEEELWAEERWMISKEKPCLLT